MAKKAKEPSEYEALKDTISKMISRGDLGLAARTVADENPSEKHFDEIMEANPGLREVYNRL